MANTSVVARNCGLEYEIFEKDNEGLLEVKETFFILFVVEVTCLYTFVTVHRAVSL